MRAILISYKCRWTWSVSEKERSHRNKTKHLSSNDRQTWRPENENTNTKSSEVYGAVRCRLSRSTLERNWGMRRVQSNKYMKSRFGIIWKLSTSSSPHELEFRVPHKNWYSVALQIMKSYRINKLSDNPSYSARVQPTRKKLFITIFQNRFINHSRYWKITLIKNFRARVKFSERLGKKFWQFFWKTRRHATMQLQRMPLDTWHNS